VRTDPARGTGDEDYLAGEPLFVHAASSLAGSRRAGLT
jgi:hypothetical protein